MFFFSSEADIAFTYHFGTLNESWHRLRGARGLLLFSVLPSKETGSPSAEYQLSGFNQNYSCPYLSLAPQ